MSSVHCTTCLFGNKPSCCIGVSKHVACLSQCVKEEPYNDADHDTCVRCASRKLRNFQILRLTVPMMLFILHRLV